MLNDTDRICIAGLKVCVTLACLIASIDLLNGQLDRAAEQAHRPAIHEVEPTARPVVLWKEVHACEPDDWGCELQVAYNTGWRP